MTYYKRINFKSVLNNFKKVKKNILAPPRKRKRSHKILLIANNLIKKNYCTKRKPLKKYYTK